MSGSDSLLWVRFEQANRILNVNMREDYIPCPICGFEYTHQTREMRWFDGSDSYEAPHGLRGDLFAMAMWSECGCDWWLCFGFHKGQTYVSARIWHGCDEAPEKNGHATESRANGLYTLDQLRGAWGAGFHKGKEDGGK